VVSNVKISRDLPAAVKVRCEKQDNCKCHHVVTGSDLLLPGLRVLRANRSSRSCMQGANRAELVLRQSALQTSSMTVVLLAFFHRPKKLRSMRPCSSVPDIANGFRAHAVLESDDGALDGLLVPIFSLLVDLDC